MSTKAIQGLMNVLYGECTAQDLADARREFEAIRKAARVLVKAEIFCGHKVSRAEFDAMEKTICAIAKEEP